MDRTNTTGYDSFTMPPPDPVGFEFIAPHQIRITIPRGSTWSTDSHWHSPDKENCLLLRQDKGRVIFAYHDERGGGPIMMGSGPFYFQAGKWTYWERKRSSKDKTKEDIVVTLVVRDDSLYRNLCSATLDAQKFPCFETTPIWLRGFFILLKLFPPARKWLIGRMLYIQQQAIYYNYGYFHYHGGINIVDWWNFFHPFEWGMYPRWMKPYQYRSQLFFSKAVQAAYYWTGRLFLGMKGDYPQYNPRFGQPPDPSEPPTKDQLAK